MRYAWMAMMLAATTGLAQTSASTPTQTVGADTGAAKVDAEQQQPAGGDSAAAGALVVPQGTAIPLTLVSQIKSKSTKPGDSVRAVVAFPVATGTQVAVPAGTYVEGMVQSVTLPKHGGPATVQIHFTRLLFANGYSVALDGINQQSMLHEGEATGELAYAGGEAPLDGTGFFAGQQTLPTPPPLPHVGPPVGAIVGGTLGTVGLLITLAAISHHHSGSSDAVLFDSGWQFQMTLVSPLTLDAARVAAAESVPARS